MLLGDHQVLQIDHHDIPKDQDSRIKRGLLDDQQQHDPKPRAQLALLSVGLFLFYGLYAVCLEWFFMKPELRPHGWFLTLVQSLVYLLISRLLMTWKGTSRVIPMETYMVLGPVTLTTMGFSNASLQYLNYPTQVIFKSCKLIPVLIGGILIQKKKFEAGSFLAAAFMSLGLIIFLLADSKVSPNFHLMGAAMLSVALAADAIIGNVQEKALKAHGATNSEVIFYSYGIAFMLLAGFLVASGRLIPAIRAFDEAGRLETYSLVLLLSCTGYTGMELVLSLVRQFGAFTAVTVTSLRKAFTITLSFFLFSKPFTIQYFVGGLIVLLGIFVNTASKKPVSRPPAPIKI